MKPRLIQPGPFAFTLVELLIIGAILAILVVFAVSMHDGPARSQVMRCLINEQQLALGLNIFGADHEDRFPGQLSVADGGAAEPMGSGEVIPAYLAVSNFVTTFDRFVCPTDRLRHGARNGQPITTANVSYFISLDASPTNSATQTVLTGDRYLEANGSQVASGLLSLRANQPVTWMKGFHFVVSHPSGNFSFADGHAEVVKSAYLQRTITNQPIPVNRVVIP